MPEKCWQRGRSSLRAVALVILRFIGFRGPGDFMVFLGLLTVISSKGSVPEGYCSVPG